MFVFLNKQNLIGYLNKFCLNDSNEKAFVVEKNATVIPTKIPTLFF